MLQIFLLYALFASVFTIGKIGLEVSQPFFLVGTRMLIAGILILAFARFIRPNQWKIEKTDLWLMALLGIFNIYLTNVFEFWGLKYLTSFKTCFIYSLSPFVSALLCFFWYKEKLSTKKWLGLTIGFIGFVPILLSQSSEEELTGAFFLFSGAEMAVLLACISSVYGWILLSQAIKRGYSPWMANGLSMTLGGVLAILHSWFVESWDPFPVTEWAPFIECTLALMFVSNFLGYNLYGHLLKKYSPTFLSFAGFTTPLFTALFGWFFLGEEVTTTFYLSAAIVFVGLSLFHQEELVIPVAENKGKT